MYDPIAKKTTHFGAVANDKTKRFAKDTLNGFTGNGAIRAFPSKDGLLWIVDFSGNIYNINFSKTTIPYFPITKIPISFYLDKEKNNPPEDPPGFGHPEVRRHSPRYAQGT